MLFRRGVTGILALSIVVSAACGDDGGDNDLVVTTEHCGYTAVPATGGNGGTVASGALMAGAAEDFLPLPIGSALGGYTSRAGFLGSEGTVDVRKVAISGAFNPSIGVESVPRIKVLALTAGGSSAILIKLDVTLMYEGLLFDVEQRLGPDYAGKLLFSVSHSHSAWGHFSAHSAYQLGLGVFRGISYAGMLDTIEATVNAALAAQRPAKIGIFSDMAFDPSDQISRDRRQENDFLLGGPRKDDSFFMIRVDGTDDQPIAIAPVFGIHGTLNDADNSLVSTDVSGALERRLEEQFDSRVVVMHLQGAGGDVSPTPHGGLDCSNKPGNENDPCFEWLRAEGNSRAALPELWAAYQQAGTAMQTDIAIEMLTRSIELGPNHETFDLRGGDLVYAPFDYAAPEADRLVWGNDGEIISPIDEFNAPVGAGLCESDEVMFSVGTIPGTYQLDVYGSCARVGPMSEIFSILLDTQFESDDTHPICQSTRTTISALRLGDYVIGTLPGEVTVPLADYVRSRSPVAADKTIVLGYSQGHEGYLLTPEDWLQGGYEPSINLWGPLEGEYVADQLLALMPLAITDQREDAAAGGRDRFVTPTGADDGLPIDDPAPLAGTIPSTVPDQVWTRQGVQTVAQPAASIQRVAGVAMFIWIGDDPLVARPRVALQYETSPDVFADVTRRSGRVVSDTDILVEYTPLPVRRVDDEPQTHYYAIEWQAVPWTGAKAASGESLDPLFARAGVPLGNYRFHVLGSSWELFSDVFAVTGANLIVSPSRDNNDIVATVRIDAEKGYRILHMDMSSNEPVPVAGGTFDVELTLSAGGPLAFSDVVSSAEGNLVVDAGADAAIVTNVRVTDRYGNTRNVALSP